MDMLRFTKVSKNNSYELSYDESSNCLFLAFYGLWDKMSQLDYFIDDIKTTIVHSKPGFSIIYDLTQYKGCITQLVNLQVEAQSLFLTAGLDKTAVLIKENELLKASVEIIFEMSGISATYFSNIGMLQNWLDSFK
jgi:hypothetical protein